jgi:hypothetical protein
MTNGGGKLYTFDNLDTGGPAYYGFVSRPIAASSGLSDHLTLPTRCAHTHAPSRTGNGRGGRAVFVVTNTARA